MSAKREALFSSKEELKKIKSILTSLLRLPLTDESIPGEIMERVFSHVRGASVLKKYDFVDVVDRDRRIGWQVKSTLSSTPVTWIRCKIPDKENLIIESQRSEEGMARLGRAILGYCNDHILQSGFEKYDLEHIGYIRLIVTPGRGIRYFERHLCSAERPVLFNPDDYVWRWSKQKETKGKEQLPALHGYRMIGGKEVKYWAWHGRGENQLHFAGESAWWPATDGLHQMSFEFPASGKLDFDGLIRVLGTG